MGFSKNPLFRRLVQNDMSTTLIWSKSKPNVEFQYMADVWANSVACYPRATYHIAGCCHLGIHCHDPRATCHITECKNFVPDRFSPYF